MIFFLISHDERDLGRDKLFVPTYIYNVIGEILERLQLVHSFLSAL